MAIVYIPSKKIYDISHDKVANNIITSIEQSFNEVKENYGNVLNKQYTFNFWQRNSTDDGIEIVYTDPQQTEGFTFNGSGDLTFGEVTATLTLPFNKISKFEFDTSTETIKLISHKLKSVQRISTDQGLTSYDRTLFYTPIVTGYTNFGNVGVITLSYSRAIVMAVGDKTQYTLSDTISLVGNYITTEENSQKIGEGENNYSLYENELIQNSNENLTKFADDILANYGKGKEVATLLCSIGEYYDENGNLVVSTNTADKMIFDHYDQVLPMVRSSWGTDIPISFNSSGNAKVFEVLGVRIYNDGEVRQELKIREVGETAFQIQLPAPILSISDNIITITDISGQATAFDIYLLGNLIDTVVDGNTFDIETLSLGGGYYTIYAVSRADGYKDSEKSKSIRFSVAHTTYYTELNEAGGVTYYITSSKYTISNGTYIIGG